MANDHLERLLACLALIGPKLSQGEVTTSRLGAGDLPDETLACLVETIVDGLSQLELGAKKDLSKEVFRSMQSMASRGATPHYDANNPDWDDKLFWVYLPASFDAEVLFGNVGLRVPLTDGLLLVFDPAQPHSVVSPGEEKFVKSHFPKQRVQRFVTGELTMPKSLAKRLGVVFEPYGDLLQRTLNVREFLVNSKTQLKVPVARLRALAKAA